MHPFYGPSGRLVSDPDSRGAGWVSMAAYLAFWAAALVVARRELDRRWPVAPRGGSGSDAALGVLRERFARGELDEAQYRAMVGVLAGGPGGAS